ncbi:hypothetical protein F5144DRAFT_572047 [Chaetomium tenue]|uniref:Uncharacterized protein n=1 Tax=Chaetomium tenue TaxID=1854479 RepID=A0ACB7P728_9PEZI|nr:hypothetical protein F5144DRAFT_572047 [Chaetomium globosum]
MITSKVYVHIKLGVGLFIQWVAGAIITSWAPCCFVTLVDLIGKATNRWKFVVVSLGLGSGTSGLLLELQNATHGP